VGGGKRRSLLALLLLHCNEVVSADRLIDELWGERPPPTLGVRRAPVRVGPPPSRALRESLRPSGPRR
jgi:hypothetical protein